MKFKEADLNHDNAVGWWFECSMISTCAPLFDDCSSNHDVETKLRKAGVLSDMMTDTESCALVVNFTTKHQGVTFIERINKYLAEKEYRMKKALDF